MGPHKCWAEFFGDQTVNASQTSLRPILVNLAYYNKLKLPLLRGLARLLKLLASWFNVTLGEVSPKAPVWMWAAAGLPSFCVVAVDAEGKIVKRKARQASVPPQARS